jgi:hypothetical protein
MNQARTQQWLGVGLVVVILAGLTFFLFRDGQSNVAQQKREILASGPVTPVVFRPQSNATRDDVPTLPAPWHDPAPANWGKATVSVDRPEGVVQTSEHSWSVKGGRIVMQVHRNVDRTLGARFVYPLEEMLPKDVVAMLRARWSINETFKLIEPLGISKEQWDGLKRVSSQTDAILDRRDQTRMLGEFQAYLDAPDKAEAERKLLVAVQGIDSDYHSATVKECERIATQVKDLFTPDQQTGLLRRFSW